MNHLSQLGLVLQWFECPAPFSGRFAARSVRAGLAALALSLSVGCSSTGPDEGEPDPQGPLDTVTPTGEVIRTETLPDGSILEETSDGFVIVTAPDGTVTITAPDGTMSVTSPDGTVTTTSPDGTKTVTSADGTKTTTSPDGSVTIVHPDGTVTVMNPNEMNPDDMNPDEMNPDDMNPGEARAVWINPRGRVDGAKNSFGIQGDWYAFGDGVTTTQSGSPYEDGNYCVHGVSTGESANWGAGIGLDLNGSGGQKMPYEVAGKLTGFRMKISGQAPTALRLHFVSDLDVDVNPFIEVNPGGDAQVYEISDAQVPFSWGVDNAGQRVQDVVYAMQLMAPGDSETGPIDICIEEFEPVYDPNSGGGDDGGVFINPDGFVTAESNDYGVTGPVYVISDGNSSTQTGVPFEDGKYCVRGEFSGSADDWGAGIAFDLNNAPGQERAPIDPSGKFSGFRLGLSGTTPGAVRVQFVLNEPQEGNQPMLVGQMNQTAVYPLAWAQVPTSWDVPDAGLAIEGPVVTMQVYVEGDVPGPFEVCIDEMSPVSGDEINYSAEPLPGAGFRTVDPAVLEGEYQTWKSRHFQDCGDGSACIPRDDGDCISEGIGYGMLLAVGNDDRDAFDKLWAYFSKHRRQSGLMNWQTSACGNVIQEGAATDGDLDAAMALIQGACRWSDDGLRSAAVDLVNSISSSAVATCNGKTVLRPGDTFGGCAETNPSYVAPAYYREFQALTGNDVWTNLLNDGYTLLSDNQSRKGGVFSDWSTDSGGVGGRTDEFGPDASRVPWRVATDYVWNGEQRAVPLLDAFRAAVVSEGGPHRAFTPNSNYRGGSALSAFSADATTSKEYTEAWLMTAVDDHSYFPGTLRPIYMMLAAGQFAAGCN